MTTGEVPVRRKIDLPVKNKTPPRHLVGVSRKNANEFQFCTNIS